MLSENDIQQLEDYQYYRLSSDERKAIERRMKEDPTYKKEAKAYLRLFKIFQVDKLEEDMRKWDREQLQPMKTARFFRLKYFALAASIALFFVVSAYLFQKNDSEPKIYANFYEAYKPLNMQTRGGEEDRLIWEARQLYKEGKYAEAIPLLAHCSKSDCQLMRATAFLETEKEDSAKAIFQELSQEQSISLEKQQIASWYLALTLVKTEDWAAAQKELEQLLHTAKEGYYIDQAKALLQAIKAI